MKKSGGDVPTVGYLNETVSFMHSVAILKVLHAQIIYFYLKRHSNFKMTGF